MSNLAIKESLTVAGVEVPNISGGFGEGKKAMLAKHIAEIHGKRLAKVNEAINNNRNRFKDNVDVIDVKNSVHAKDSLLQARIFNKQSISNSENIYLLSERGYAKLIKIFNDDKSWELYDMLLDEYFELRDANVVQMNNQPSTQLQILQNVINQMVENEQKMLEMNNKVVQIETRLNNHTVEDGYVTANHIARELDLFSNSDKPHGMFVDAIAKELKIYSKNLGYKDEYVNVVQDVVNGGIATTVIYYSEKSKKLIKEYLDNKFKLETTFFVRGNKKGEINKIKYELNKVFEFNKYTYEKYK